MKLKLSDLGVNYGNFEAARDINLNIEANEFFTLLGPSGSGKSTIMRAITGFNTISQGQILLDNHEISQLPPEKRAIGMVFQNYALFPTMNVYDNIAYGLKLQKMSTQAIAARVEAVTRMVQLSSDNLKKGISELSGGQQQRVAIARSLAPNPSLLLLDEPLSNLDARLRVELRKELKRLQRELKMTIIYVTHDQSEALTLSDHIAVIHNGRVEQIGTPKAIYQTPKTEFVANFIGEINLLSSAIVSHLDTSSWQEDAHYYIRPEHLSFEAGEIAINGTVLTKEYYGVNYSYTIAIPGGTMDILADTQFEYQLDDMVTLFFNRAHVLEFVGGTHG